MLFYLVCPCREQEKAPEEQLLTPGFWMHQNIKKYWLWNSINWFSLTCFSPIPVGRIILPPTIFLLSVISFMRVSIVHKGTPSKFLNFNYHFEKKTNVILRSAIFSIDAFSTSIDFSIDFSTLASEIDFFLNPVCQQLWLQLWPVTWYGKKPKWLGILQKIMTWADNSSTLNIEKLTQTNQSLYRQTMLSFYMIEKLERQYYKFIKINDDVFIKQPQLW